MPPGKPPQIAVIIPAYNEAGRILPTLQDAAAWLDLHFQDWRILVVNDGSKDATAQVVLQFSEQQPKVGLHNLDRNRGKGCAVRTGVGQTDTELVLYMDADGAIPISELDKLLPGLKEHHLVIGSKSFPDRGSMDHKWYRLIMGRVFNFFVRLFLIQGVHDSQCGFKLFRGDAARTIFRHQGVNGFSFDLEVLRLARLLGYSFGEAPVKWSNISGSRVHIVRDSIKMFWDIFRIRARHRGKNFTAGERPSQP